eukprot:sb/3477601/
MRRDPYNNIVIINDPPLGVDTTTQPQYMRIAVDNGHADTIKKMERLFTEFWKLNEPDLLISVTGGAKSFAVSNDICKSFQQGLLSAAKSTNAWLVTGGQNCVSVLQT